MRANHTTARQAGLLILLVLCIGGIFGCGDDRPKALRMGDPGPEFSATDLNGAPISLAAFQGKPVVIRFFLPDCKYCRADTVVFNEYYRAYHDKGLGVIYINTAPKPEDVPKFVAELGISFPVILDPERKIADQYRIQVVPQTVVLDPGHKVIGAILGGVSKEQLDALLLPFLK